MNATALVLALTFLGTASFLHGAQAATVLAKEPTTLRLGERVLIDDGVCAAGEIREVTGIASKTVGSARVERLSKCIQRKINR